jgi:predicted transcriptional regulator
MMLRRGDARLGLTITIARTIAGVNRTELARRVGSSRSYIYQIEAGWRRPSDSLLVRILRALGERHVA